MLSLYKTSLVQLDVRGAGAYCLAGLLSLPDVYSRSTQLAQLAQLYISARWLPQLCLYQKVIAVERMVLPEIDGILMSTKIKKDIAIAVVGIQHN